MTRGRAVGAVLVTLAVIGAGVFGVRRSSRAVMADQPTLPTARVNRGALDLTVHMTGDLRAARQQAIVAPTVGGNLRILKLLDPGTTVAKDDVILEFDPADQQ